MSSQRDAGLVRAIGPVGLAASIIGTVVGSAIFVVPSMLAASLGAYAPLAFLGCGVPIGAVAICFAEGGSRIPTSGGVYGYIAAALGPAVGYVAGTLLWVSDMLACAGVAAALGDVMVSLVPGAPAQGVRALVIIAVIGSVALINSGGVARGTRLIEGTTLLKLVPLVIFVAVGAAVVHGANYSVPVQWRPGSAGQAALLALFACIGMETALCASGEVDRPSRTIPLALGIAIVSIIVLYMAVQFIAQGILGAGLAHSAAPLADAMGRVSPGLRAMILIGASFSMFGTIAVDVLNTPRLVFAFARDGLLPRFLARVHERTHVPRFAILSYAALAIVLALSGTFAELAEFAVLAAAGLFVLGCISAWLLARRGVALAGEPLRFRWLGTAVVLGVGGMMVVIGLATRAQLIGLLALIASSLVVYRVQTRFAPARADS